MRQRGFDDRDGWLNPWTWVRAEGDPSAAVGATFAAVSAWAGWASVLRFDPECERDRAALLSAARELEYAAGALRGFLNEGRNDDDT